MAEDQNPDEIQEEVRKIKRIKVKQDEKRQEHRQATNALKINYQKIKDEPAFKDIVAYCGKMMELHTAVARSGMGGRSNMDGSQEVVYLDAYGKAAEIDKSSGNQEILNHIKMMLKEDTKEENSQE